MQTPSTRTLGVPTRMLSMFRSRPLSLAILLAVAPLGAAAVAVLGQRYAMARMRF